MFTFAFVRHPLTWYQSYFSYKQWKGWDRKNDWDHKVRSDKFEEFVEKAIEETPAYYSKLIRRFVGWPNEEIDFVGRFERLTEDLIRALQLAGESFDPEEIKKVPPENQSDYRQHPAVYTDELAARVLEAFRDLSEQAASCSLDEEIPVLTARERQVLRCVAEGAMDREIADQLTISLSTVKTHVRNILSKLHASSRHQAALLAMREGLIRPPAQGDGYLEA